MLRSIALRAQQNRSWQLPVRSYASAGFSTFGARLARPPMLKFWKSPDPLADLSAEDAASTNTVVDPSGGETSSNAAAEPKTSWLRRLKGGLAKTGSSITSLFGGGKVDEALFENLESALLMADAGVDATSYLIQQLRARARKEGIEDARVLKAALGSLLVDLLRSLEKPLSAARDPAVPTAPVVMMMVGVNGAGKTTSIGKLAKYLQGQGRSVLLAAGDTFRAAAREQLVVWGDRNGVAVIAQHSGDPAAVVFDAIASASARGVEVLIADTAGRLPTQLHLMDELRKIKRVINKAPALAGVVAPREVLLVIDGNTGQNAIAQVKAFDAAVGLTGLIVTKLDGTAKGGVLAAIALTRKDAGAPPIPVYFIGVGERLDDLQPFVASQFVAALLED